MKRVIISSIILILVLGVCIFGQFYVKETKEKAVSMLETACMSIDQNDFETAKTQVSNFTNYWDEKEKYLTIMVRHHQIEEIGAYAATLLSAVECEDTVEFYLINAKMIKILEMIWETERPQYYNIF